MQRHSRKFFMHVMLCKLFIYLLIYFHQSNLWVCLDMHWKENNNLMLMEIDVNDYVGIDQNGWEGCYYALNMNHLK